MKGYRKEREHANTTGSPMELTLRDLILNRLSEWIPWKKRKLQAEYLYYRQLRQGVSGSNRVPEPGWG